MSNNNNNYNQQILQSTNWVANQSSQHVQINKNNAAFTSCAIQFIDQLHNFNLSCWKSNNPLHPQSANTHAAEFIFVLDLLNFSFWNDNDNLPFTVKYLDNTYTGYWSLVACIRRAMDQGTDLTNPFVMRALTMDQCIHLFRSETEAPIPLIHERLKILQAAGSTLIKCFDGSFTNIIRQANKSCQSLIRLVLDHFPSFRDVSTYKDQQVFLLKRVQILVADLWACFEGQDLGEFYDIDLLTMFADYRVPQSLVYLNLIHYSTELMDMLNRKQVFSNGDPLEVEIRAASIWAVEKLRGCINELLGDDSQLGTGVNAIMIDFYLWDFAKLNSAAMQDIPIHRTRSIYY